MEYIKEFTITPQEGSTVTIEGEIPADEFESHRSAAIAHLGKDIEVDGFRKGTVPEQMIVERVGEDAILNEMAERALSKVYPEAVKEHGLDVIGYPKVSITKLAKGNPLGFRAEVAVVPEVELPDYKKIAADTNKEKPSDEVTDEDVDKQIEDILRQKAAYDRLQQKAADGEQNADEQSGDNATDLPTPESEAAKQAAADEGEPEPPELTDELVKTLGQPGQFENVEDFKAKIREHLAVQKKQDNAAAQRSAITDAIIAVTEVTVPAVLIDAEINQMFAQMEEDLKRAQLSMDDYLSHIKKTKEELIEEWRPAAEKRAKLQLILNAIAKAENISADTSLVDEQVSELMERFKDADEARVRTYVESVLQNEAVMKMLETQEA